MTTLADLLAEAPARHPLRLVAASDLAELKQASAARGVVVVDVKRLQEAGCRDAQGVLVHLARALGRAEKEASVEDVAMLLTAPGPRVVLARVPDDWLEGLLACLCGVVRAMYELLGAWDGPPRIVLAFTRGQAARSWTPASASSAFDFADPPFVAFPDGARALPKEVASLEEGARALLAGLPALPPAEVDVIPGWPALALPRDARQIEALPAAILKAFIAGGRDLAEQRHRARASQILGAGLDDLRKPATGAKHLRHLASWVLPPAVRRAASIEHQFFTKPLWRAALAHEGARRKEIDALLRSDALIQDAGPALDALLRRLGESPILSWDVLHLGDLAGLELTPADHGRLQLAAALETTYRLRNALAHGTTRAASPWVEAADRVAAYVAAAGLLALEPVWPARALDPAVFEVPPAVEKRALAKFLASFPAKAAGITEGLLGERKSLPAALLARALADEAPDDE